MAKPEFWQECLKAAAAFTVVGLATFWLGLLLAEEISGMIAGLAVLVLFVAVIAALCALRRKPLYSLGTAVAICGLSYLSLLFAPLGPRDWILNGRVNKIRNAVAELRQKVGDANLVEVVIADPKVAEGYKRAVSKTNPPAISFLVRQTGLDNGANLIFDPSASIEKFISPKGKINKEAEGWSDYKALVLYEPVWGRKLAEGWYLIYFT
jgi:hypothetical protein